MNRITIDVSQDELDFIREAVAHKYLQLIAYLHECETTCQSKNMEKKSVFDEAHARIEEVDAQEKQQWTVTTKNDGSMIAKTKPAKKQGRPAKKTKAAPWGLKKDGTPKKRPGRQPA